MGQLQLGKKFTDEEKTDIVAFLKTLTGQQPDFKVPVLPPSADDTPRPDPYGKALKVKTESGKEVKTAAKKEDNN